MTLAPGSRLGPYEITAPLGAGGMGEVYRAHDRKLNRDVAIKVLPDPSSDDPERLARFTREAQTLAALNHPNVGAIYGATYQIARDGRHPAWSRDGRQLLFTIPGVNKYAVVSVAPQGGAPSRPPSRPPGCSWTP
jgi:serine/threonine protein kinase